mmetsp:Transcript_81954/g.213801  ORF Transcript_81954/g.213801 Transcript_81954/m.213801 type:complete len:207 (+) Transcript_81954:274-894(+)
MLQLVDRPPGVEGAPRLGRQDPLPLPMEALGLHRLSQLPSLAAEGFNLPGEAAHVVGGSDASQTDGPVTAHNLGRLVLPRGQQRGPWRTAGSRRGRGAFGAAFGVTPSSGADLRLARPVHVGFLVPAGARHGLPQAHVPLATTVVGLVRWPSPKIGSSPQQRLCLASPAAGDQAAAAAARAIRGSSVLGPALRAPRHSERPHNGPR